MRRISVYKIMLLIVFSFFLMQCGQPPNQKNAGNNTQADSMKNSENQKQSEEDLVPVEVTTVTKGDISDFILLSSNLETEIMADVFSRIQGIVEEIHKEEGQYVKKDEVLLSLEAEEYELAEQRARVEYDKQLNNFERVEEMYNKQLLSLDEYEKAKFALEAARLAWEETKLNLDFAQIKSPINGWVGERLAKKGARIQPTNKLFSIVNDAQVIAVVWVPEKNINQLRRGQEVIITSDHLENKKFNGRIKRISPVVDPASGTFKVTVGVRNRGRVLRPGMFVNVHIIIDTHEDVVLIPKTAVVYEKEYMNVFVVRDNVAHKIRLKPGFEDNEKIESLEGIEEGEKIIVVGQSGMKDETPVKIVSERENKIGYQRDEAISGN